MAGVSEMPFRTLARQMGASAAPTELISAKGLIYGSSRSERYLRFDKTLERPFWVQIFGGDPESMAQGAERACELGAEIIDVNMGCPVKKVTKNGAGSALLQDAKRAALIVAAIVKRTQVPVTCKIRAGWDVHSLNYLEMVKALADAGCAAIAMHARTRAQGYSGQANWHWIRDLVEQSPIPVLGNGDVFTVQTAHELLQTTGCQAILIGRGALGNPWIFSELKDPKSSRPSPQERLTVVLKHLKDHLDFCDSVVHGICRFRQHLMWYSHGLTGGAAFRSQVNTIEDLEQLRTCCEQFFSQAGNNGDPSAQSFDVSKALG